VKGKPHVKRGYPAGWYLYAGLITVSSLLVATGHHRAVYSLLRASGIPSMGISILAGLLNLSWYEIAYAVGGGLKMVGVYNALPILGCATGLLSGGLILTGLRLRRPVLLVHLSVSLVLSSLALVVLVWRLVRGMGDPWRITTTLVFLAATCAWAFYFRRTRGTFRVSSRGGGD